jgi:hypothetical protein
MLSEVREHSGADAGLPDVEFAGAIREEGDELSVGRDFGSFFRALPVRQESERAGGKINRWGCYVASQPTHRGRNDTQQDGRDPRRTTPAP